MIFRTGRSCSLSTSNVGVRIYHPGKYKLWWIMKQIHNWGFSMYAVITYFSMPSNLFSRASRVSAMRTSCCFSSIGLGWVQNIQRNKPAKENSIEPSSLSPGVGTFWRNPSNVFWRAFLFASSASFRSSSSSYRNSSMQLFSEGKLLYGPYRGGIQ